MNVLAWLGSQMESKESEAQDLGGVSCAFPVHVSFLLTIQVVEINLRLPSMLHGKKGFDRIVYAFKNVLTKPVTWLFINLQAQGMCIFRTGSYHRLLTVRQRAQQIPLKSISQSWSTALQRFQHRLMLSYHASNRPKVTETCTRMTSVIILSKCMSGYQ
jgi:hypothetical protein